MKISIKQTLVESAFFYKQNFKKFCSLSLCISLVTFIYTGILVIMGYLQTIAFINPFFSLLLSLVLFVIMILALILNMNLQLAMPLLLDSLFGEYRLTTTQAIKQTTSKIWTIIKCSFLIGLLYLPVMVVVTIVDLPFISIIGTVCTAFILAIFYMLYPMVAIEPGTNRYLRKSAKMIKGNYIPALLLTLITSTSLTVLNSVMTEIFQDKIILLAVIQIIYYVALFFLYPFAQAATVVVYRQLKYSPGNYYQNVFTEQKVMYCGSCGTKTVENARFCATCGSPLDGETRG